MGGRINFHDTDALGVLCPTLGSGVLHIAREADACLDMTMSWGPLLRALRGGIRIHMRVLEVRSPKEEAVTLPYFRHLR